MSVRTPPREWPKNGALLEKVPKLPDAQCAWLVLALCAVPRANHLLRTVPPSVSAGYAAAHDDLLWETLLKLLGEEPHDAQHLALARLVAELPVRLGGLGLQSAARTAPAAYWAGWADSLAELRKRCPAGL